MKVLYITGAVGVGGVETFLESTSAAAKVESYYFLFRDGPLRERLEKRGAKVFLSRTDFRLRNPVSLFFLVREIMGLMKRLKIDLLHSSMAYSAIPGAMAAYFSKRKHIWFQHGPIGGWMDRLAAFLPAELVLCNSSFILEQQKKLGSGKLRVLPLGTPLAEPVVAVKDSLQVVMLCRAQRWKGAHLLVDALRILKTSGKSVKGEIYLGDFGNDYSETLMKSAECGIFPANSDLNEVLNGKNVLVNASLTPEPFGLTIIEAMMRGLVPIAPRCGGPMEIIEDGKSGLFFEPGNARDLAEKIASLSDKELLERLSKGAREKALAEFDLKIMLERLEKIYSESR